MNFDDRRIIQLSEFCFQNYFLTYFICKMSVYFFFYYQTHLYISKRLIMNDSIIKRINLFYLNNPFRFTPHINLKSLIRFQKIQTRKFKQKHSLIKAWLNFMIKQVKSQVFSLILKESEKLQTTINQKKGQKIDKVTLPSQSNEGTREEIQNSQQIQPNSSLICQNSMQQPNIGLQGSKVQENERNNQSLKKVHGQQQVYKEKLLKQYFQQIYKQNTSQNSTAQKYFGIIQSSLQRRITSGELKIDIHREDIKNLLVQSKISEEELKILEKRTNAEIRQKKNRLLDPFRQKKLQKQKTQSQQNSPLGDHVNDLISSSILSKEQHKRLISKFRISNKKLAQLHRQRLFQKEERQRSLSLEKAQAQEQRLRKQKQMKKLSIQQKLSQRKQQHEKIILQQKFSSEKYNQMKKRKFLYQNMEQRYRSQVLIPVLEEKKMKLRQIRDFNKKYDISQIKKYQLQYLQKRSLSTNKQLSRHKQSTFQYNPPQKSKRLVELLELENQKAKIKFEQKKKMMEENTIKKINFLSEIKTKFKPKIDQKKRQEIEKRLKGQNAQKNHSSSQINLKQLGMKYFEEARKRIKRKDNKQKTEGGDFQKQEDPQHKLRRTTKQKTQVSDAFGNQESQNQFISAISPRKRSTTRTQKKINLTNSSRQIKITDSKRKEIKKIINSDNLEREQKLFRLKMQNERINEIYKRRERFFRENEDDQTTRQEAIGLLLTSIQAKMGIIDICSERR